MYIVTNKSQKMFFYKYFYTRAFWGNCYFIFTKIFLLLMFYDSSKCQPLCIETISRLYFVACTVQKNNS